MTGNRKAETKGKRPVQAAKARTKDVPTVKHASAPKRTAARSSRAAQPSLSRTGAALQEIRLRGEELTAGINSLLRRLG